MTKNNETTITSSNKTPEADQPMDDTPVKRNWIDNVKDDVDWSVVNLPPFRTSRQDDAAETNNPIHVSNPHVPLPEGLQHTSHFLSPEEIQQVVDLVPVHDNQAYTWEGFDHRRRVWKFATDTTDKSSRNDKILPDSTGILSLIWPRLAQQFTHLLPMLSSSSSSSSSTTSAISDNWSVSIHEYPTRKINLSGEYASNQTVTSHESQALLYSNNNKKDNEDDHENYFVAYIALTRTAIQHLHLPATRRGISWSLQSPNHYTDIQMVPGALWIKQGAALCDWRHQLRASQNKRQEPVLVLRIAYLPPPLSTRIVHTIREENDTTNKINHQEEVEEPFGYMNTPANQRLQQERQSIPRPPMAELLTIIITTSPIRSNPETELLERIAETFIHAGEEFAYECPKVIVCDGVRRTDDEMDTTPTESINTEKKSTSAGQPQPEPKVTKKHSTDKQAMRNGIVKPEQAERYDQFKANLQKLCREAGPRSLFANTTVHELDERQGYGFALRHALRHCVQTPYVCVIQHDRTFMRPTPMTQVIDAMWNHPHIKYVGMNMRSNLTYRDTVCSKYGGAYVDEYLDMILRPPELLVSAEDYGPQGSSLSAMKEGCHPKIWKSIQSTAQAYQTSQQNLGQEEWLASHSVPPGKYQMTLSPTLFWFDNVHVCETAFYRDFVFDPARKMVVRGGFVEDKLSPVMIRTCERLGLTEGHARFGCYILDDHAGTFFTGHLDGGSYMTKEQKQEVSKDGRKQQKQKMPSTQREAVIKEEDQSSATSKGGTTTVVFASRKNAKNVKELLDKSGYLDKNYRMGPSQVDEFSEMIAIPVISEQASNLEMLSVEGVVGQGRQLCSYSTGILGNQKGKMHASLQKDNITPIEKALISSLKQSMTESKSDNWIIEQLRKLSKKTIPQRLENFGDDRTLVIHSRVLSDNDPSFSAFLRECDVSTKEEKERFFSVLWETLAIELGSPRVVRKGEVQPDSRVRESNFRILWPSHEERHHTDKDPASSSGPKSHGWITVTEQGIRQSFDMTKVMFSRGNISEKVRFGKLVKPGEVVLDLYAGIGYFTLPALVHGKAKHVYACEWNPYAIQALQFNLQDNHVNDRSTVFRGDSRTLVSKHNLQGLMDRISLGLLPSSEGGWEVAIQALRRDRGGWLHVHANVVAKEIDDWSLWLCSRLAEFVTKVGDRSTESDWAVLCFHMEKVKSFAPTVNHYVADVFVGPNYEAHVTPNLVGCIVSPEGLIKFIPEGSQIRVPSCALSADGALHQSWMREIVKEEVD